MNAYNSAGKMRTKTTWLLYKSRLFGQNEQHSELNFCYPKKKKRKKEKHGGHIIKCLLTELGRAGRENIWPAVMAYGPSVARSVRHDRASHSVNKYILIRPNGTSKNSTQTWKKLYSNRHKLLTNTAWPKTALTEQMHLQQLKLKFFVQCWLEYFCNYSWNQISPHILLLKQNQQDRLWEISKDK